MTPSPSPTPAAGPVTFRFRLETRPREVPLYVTQYRFSARDAANNLVYGPVLRSKTAEIVLTDVPPTATQIQLDYLANETVIGLFRSPLTLPAVFNDPDFVDVETLANVTVTPATGPLTPGGQRQFTAQGTFTDGRTYDLTTTVTWSSSQPTVANVSRDGLAQAQTPGSTVIQATLAGRAGQLTQTVSPFPLTSLALSPLNPSLRRQQTQTFRAQGTYQDGSTRDLSDQVTWTSSNTSVAALTPQGVATAAALGTTTIRATLGNSTAATNLTVTERVPLTLQVTPLNATVQLLGRLQYAANATFPGSPTVENVTGEVTWTSSAPEKAGVGPDGIAVGLFVGNASIRASLGGVTASGNLQILDTSTGGPAPTPTPTTARLYVGTFDRWLAYANPATVDGTGATPVVTSTVVGDVREVALDATRDTLYVADLANTQVAIFTPASSFGSGAPTRTIRAVTGIYGLAIDPVGDRLYLSSTASRTVEILDNASTLNDEIGSLPRRTIAYGAESPQGMDYDRANDRLYLVGLGGGANWLDVLDNASTRTNLVGRRRITSGFGNLNLFFPLSCSFDPGRNRLYVSDSARALLCFNNPTGTATMAGAAIAANGRINGTSAFFSGLNGLVIHPTRDEVYLTDSGGSIFVYPNASAVAGDQDLLPARTIGDFTSLNFPWGLDVTP